MSTYVTRIIQVRKDNKWENLPIYSDYDFKEHFQVYKDGKPSKELTEQAREKHNHNGLYLSDINSFTDNMMSLRSTLADKFGNRGWDKFCPPKPECDDWNGVKITCGYNFGWCTLKELYALANELESKFFAEYTEIMQNNKLNIINNKLNRLLKLNKEDSEETYDKEDSEEIFDEEITNLKEDKFWELLAINDEIEYASRLAELVSGVFSSDNIRIVFYYD